MIRLKKLALAGFRGSPKFLPIEFDSPPRSIAIYGDNAAGKSSITDAVEWFYSSKVEHLWRENCKADALRNVLLPTEDAATVELHFNDSNLDCKKSIASDLTVSQSNNTANFIEYLAKIENGHERITLRTIDILYFTLEGKTERRKELERIIGYEALDKFREIVRSTLYQLEKTPEYITSKNNFQSQQKEILKIARINIFSDKELFESGQRIAVDAGIPASISDWASYEAAGADMRAKLHNKDQGIKKAALADCRKKCELFFQTAKASAGGLEIFSDAYAKLIGSQEQIRQIRLGGFLVAGKKAIDDLLASPDTCPLCLQTIPWDKLSEELEIRIAKVTESKTRYDEAVDQKGQTLSILDEVLEASGDFVETAAKAELDIQFVRPIQDFSSALEFISQTITNEFDSFRPISTDLEEQRARALESAVYCSPLKLDTSFR
jgi:hypothetical protein